VKNILTFTSSENIIITSLKKASWLTEYCHTANFGLAVQILKVLNVKSYSANFDENCKVYSKEVPVNDISV